MGQVGFDQLLNGNDDFELGGYPAVNDALHGWLRDDVWLLGSKMYVVVARPVEYDVTQRPAGAIVGVKEVNARFAADLAKRTRTNVAFFASGKNVATGVGTEGFDAEKLDAVGAELQKVDDKTYGEGGRSEVRMLTDELGAIYARLPGDVWPLGGGFAVARGKTPLGGPMGFLSGADDKDKANVPWILLVGVAVAAGLIGILLTIPEHSAPLGELVVQAERFKSGAVDGLQVARFRGAYRLAAQGINQGLEKAIEKSGGVTRQPADLESILGPTPAQPAMSAFSFPNAADVQAPAIAPVPAHASPPPAAAVPASAPQPASPRRPQQARTGASPRQRRGLRRRRRIRGPPRRHRDRRLLSARRPSKHAPRPMHPRLRLRLRRPRSPRLPPLLPRCRCPIRTTTMRTQRWLVRCPPT